MQVERFREVFALSLIVELGIVCVRCVQLREGLEVNRQELIETHNKVIEEYKRQVAMVESKVIDLEVACVRKAILFLP